MQSKLTLSAVAVAGLLAFGTAGAQQAQEVKLGFAAPLTGAQAHYGKDMQNGIQMAVDEYNATKPTIEGKPVKFVLQSEDDQADPRQGSLVAQKLVDSGIKGMLGHFNSGTTIPASRIYAGAGIPEIAMATAPEYTKQGFKTTFRMMTSDIQQGSVVGTFAVKKLGFKNIAIVVINNPSSPTSFKSVGATNTMPMSCDPVSVKLYRLFAATSRSRETSDGTSETTAGLKNSPATAKRMLIA